MPNLKVEVEDDKFRITKIYTYTEIIKQLCEGNLKFECTGKNSGGVNNTQFFKSSFFIEDIKDAKYKEHAIFRFEVIRPLLDVPVSQRRSCILSRVDLVNSWSTNPLVAKEKLNNCSYYQTVSRSSIYRWLKDYLLSNKDIRSLFPSYHLSGAKDKTRLDSLVTGFIKESIMEMYNTSQRITIRELWYNIVYKISEYNKFTSGSKLKTPHYATVARNIEKIPEYKLIEARIGKRTANNKFEQIGNGVEVNYPLERVEIDHTPIDIILVDNNGAPLPRPHLILAIDKCTRYILGFTIGIGNSVGWPEVMQCIKNIMRDKSYVKEIYSEIENEWTAFGLPKTIVVDNGLEFKNNAMKDACYQLGIILQFCPPRVPQWKGSIERFFGTCNKSLLHSLPGTTRSNPTKLGDDEKPLNTACLTFSTFLYLIHLWIIDVYSQDFNKGAEGKPSAIWNKAIEDYPVTFPNSISETAILLGKTAYRKITRRGIEILNLNYNCDELNKVLLKFNKENDGRDKDFLVKYDPQNISEVFLYDHLITNKWVRVPCLNEKYSKNLSEWEHKEIHTLAKKDFGMVDVESLARAKHKIRQLIDNSLVNKNKNRAYTKKINSEHDINKQLDVIRARTKDKNYLEVATLSHDVNNISDLGFSIKPSNIIIPESLSFKMEQEQPNNVLPMNINSGKVKQKNSSTNRKAVSTPENTDNIETDNNFTGFEVISDIPEMNTHE